MSCENQWLVGWFEDGILSHQKCEMSSFLGFFGGETAILKEKMNTRSWSSVGLPSCINGLTPLHCNKHVLKNSGKLFHAWWNLKGVSGQLGVGWEKTLELKSTVKIWENLP